MKPIRDSFTITVADEEYEVDLAELATELKIDPVDAGDDLRDQPGHFAWVAELCAQAEFIAGLAKQDLVVLKAAVARELRDENATREKGQRLTENAIEERVTTDERVMDAVEDYLEESRKAAMLVALREAYRHRKDMLNALSYGTRQRERAEE